MESEDWTWPTVPLGSIAKFRAGSAFKTEHQGGQTGEIPFIKVSDFSLPENSFQIQGANNWVSRAKASEIKAALHPPGATVFAKIGVALTYNRRRLLVRDTAIDNNLMSAAPIAGKVSSQFLYCLLSHLDFNVIANGSALPYLNVSDLQKIEVGLPPREIQGEIAGTLMTLQQRIDLLRQTNATLESIAQALFKSWFIDFDPVRAKTEGREPDGMDAAKAALFPAEFEESELGVIPKGWQASAIRDVVEGIYDGPHATPPEASAGPVFLGIKNLTGTSLDLSEIRHVDERDWARWTRRVTPTANDIVFSYEAALGLFALVPPHLRCCLGRRLALVRAKARDGTPHFWFHQFVSPTFQQLLAKHTVHGATVNRIALKEFPSYKVLNPPVLVRTAFEQAAAPLWARIHLNSQLVQVLSSVRDTLLPRLISGKLRMPEAEAQLEEAAE
ncbi:hypothetical protein ABIF68_001636 [Bradyrhizobium japonicum]